ncbi:MAG: phage tail protein [Ruminococcus sp.]|nr:phage tail protein [Ruminiclostridium sp.]MBP1537450.1 phage tail protein [Ruminococcus sp.]
MALKHGVNTYKNPTNFAAVKEADVAIPFFVGCWPCHAGGGFKGEPQMVTNWDEAIELGGYSPDWLDEHNNPKWTLCEALYSHLKLFCMTPCIVYNIYNPATHKSAVAETTFTVSDHVVSLPYDTIDNSNLVVKSGDDTLVKETDYTVYYDYEYNRCCVELLDGSHYNDGTLKIAYDKSDLSSITTAVVEFAIEQIEKVFGKYNLICDLICVPGWSEKPSVAAVMAAKAPNINGLFKGKAVVDIPTDAANGAPTYNDVYTWKRRNGYTDENEIDCWPLVKVGDYRFHLSVMACGQMSKVDNGNGSCPYESPSNKGLTITGACNAAGQDIDLNLQQADVISVNAGVVTALNFQQWVLWGNYTGCFPASSDVSKMFICTNRMMDWICNTFVLTYWPYVDRPMTRPIIDAIINSFNSWLNGLTHESKLYGGEIKYIPEYNPLTKLIGGSIRLDTIMASPVPMQQINMYETYDVSIVEAALNG